MKKLKKTDVKHISGVMLKLILGCAINAFGVDVFYNPAKLLSGGATGIAQILNFEFGVSVSLMVLLINVPLIILALICVNLEFSLYSIAGTLILSFFLRLFSGISFNFSSQLTSVALGGILNGFSLGIVYRSGASTGGTDIVSKILHKYRSGNMAYTSLIINSVIVGVSALIFGLDQAVLTVVTMFISSKVNSFIIDGMDHRRALFIVTTRPDEVAAAIHTVVGRGATVIKAYGTFTHERHDIIYSVISRHQLEKTKRIIKKIDPEAFFTITKVTGVYGNGKDFRSIKKDIS